MGEALSPAGERDSLDSFAAEGALSLIVAGEWTHYLLRERLLPREGEALTALLVEGALSPNNLLTLLF